MSINMTEKKYDVIALGELLIDFTENGESENNNPVFEANPGGAPCNVLAMINKLSGKTAFIGKVGDDYLGHMLSKRAEEAGIDVSGLFFDEAVHTTLAFVHTFPGGDRDFSFYRKPGADVRLTADEVKSKENLIKDSKAFHFGTLSMTDDSVFEATKAALQIAKENDLLISFDPNYRAPLWDSEDEAREKIIFGLKNCDVLKISDNEVTFLTGEEDILKGIKKIIDEYNIKIVFLTAGPEGSYAFYKGKEYFQKAYLSKNTIETTGAGDTFMASVLYFVVKNGIENLNDDIIKEALDTAAKAASIITTRKGALSVMPSISEIKNFTID